MLDNTLAEFGYDDLIQYLERRKNMEGKIEIEPTAITEVMLCLNLLLFLIKATHKELEIDFSCVEYDADGRPDPFINVVVRVFNKDKNVIGYGGEKFTQPFTVSEAYGRIGLMITRTIETYEKNLKFITG